MRKFLGLMIVGALSFGVVSFATADEAVQTEEGKIKPSKLSKKKPQNIQFVNTITTFDQPGAGPSGQQPPSAQRTILDLPKQFKINNTKVKYCKTDAAGLEEATSTEDAVKACGKKSLVSDPKGSKAEITVDFGPTAEPGLINVDVSAFNEKPNTLLLYSKPVGDASGIPASILVGKLAKFGKVPGRPRGTASGPYKQSLDVTIPPLAAGAISLFEVTIKKSKYIQAKCKPKTLNYQATTFFTNAPTASDTATSKCKVKK